MNEMGLSGKMEVMEWLHGFRLALSLTCHVDPPWSIFFVCIALYIAEGSHMLPVFLSKVPLSGSGWSSLQANNIL